MKYIPTSKGCQAIVDDDMFEILSQYKWHNSGKNYLGDGYTVNFEKEQE